MRLVVGLGNPGRDYADTRHNVGWWVVERLIARWQGVQGPGGERYQVWRADHPGPRPDAVQADAIVHLMKPSTYMNVSGDALREWRERHRVEPGELMVIADDVYLPVGSVRLRASGSSGGHRGLESIEAALGTRAYARLRVGIGAVDGSEIKQHVLAEPDGEERDTLEQAADRAADAVECWIAEGLPAAMNRFNRKARKEVSES